MKIDTPVRAPHRMRSLKLSMISALCAAPATCWLAGCDAKHAEAPPPPPPDVVVAEVKQKDVPIYRDWVGTLAGDVNATISAQVSGYLIARDYEEGRGVKKGQVLFRIDPAPFESVL